jgi:hypothetical protein
MPDAYAVKCPACHHKLEIEPPRHSAGGRMGAARLGCPGCKRTLNVRWPRSLDDRNVKEDAGEASVVIYDGMRVAFGN